MSMMAKSRKPKVDAFNLVDVFKYTTKTKHANARLDLLASHIKRTGREEPNGWFYKQHFNNNISHEEALLYTRATLSFYCLRSYEFSQMLARAFIAHGAAKTKIDKGFLSQIFSPVPHPRGDGILQEVQRHVYDDMVDAIESPAWLIRHLSENQHNDAGWLLDNWFVNIAAKAKGKRNKRFTCLEAKVFRLQTLLIISYECSHLNRPNESDSPISHLRHAWGAKFNNNHKIGRDMATFFDECCKSKFKIIKLPSDNDGSTEVDVFFPHRHPAAPACTPVKTRSNRDLTTPSTTTPATTTREMRSRVRFLSSAKKLAASVTRHFKRQKESTTPIGGTAEEAKEEVTDGSQHHSTLDTGWSETSTTSRLRLDDGNHNSSQSIIAGNDGSLFSWSPVAPPMFDWSSPSPPTKTAAEMHNDSPTCRRPLRGQAGQSKKFTFNEEEVDQRLEKMLEDGNKSSKSQDAESVLNTVLHLSAVGSRTVQSTMKSVLVQSMPNNRATQHLKDDGYAKKRIERTLQSKRRINQARRRKAMKHGIQPRLLPETTALKYKAPHSRKSARDRSQLLYTEYLEKGRDIPPPIRYCNIKTKKIDWLVKWIVDNFQFRPGKTRNVLFKKEGGLRLRDLPIYMRYGSFSSNYDIYCSACPDPFRVGRDAFRTILKATTLKGTYNQGLSYYYVDFLDMTKLVTKMLQRLQTIADNDQSISNNKRAAIKNWIEKAKENTDASKGYLTRQFYSDIRKDTKDGWCCATFALGHSGADNRVEFHQDKPLSLALSNSIFLVHAISLVMNAVSDNSLEALHEELLSMIELAKISALEMLHYAKHLMRGWWQDNSINETKGLLASFPTLKAVVMDHKNKLLPQSKFEAMSAYFAKHGISILGAMVLWYGKKKIKGADRDGLFVWFIDTIMNNTTSQEARDLMPGIEAIRAELQQEYFQNIAGKTAALCFFSDNALIAASHSAFIHSLNKHSTASDNAPPCAEEDAEHNNPTTGTAVETTDDKTARENNSTTSATAELVDMYVAQLRGEFSHRIKNWSTAFEPFIVKWLTWEAQRGKTQLDTHFAYLNKQLTKACLQGEIDYLDPQKVFQALSYQGGSRATTTLLLDELEAAQTFYDQCDKAIADRKGIKSVHDITWKSDMVELRHYTNLDTGEKVLATSDAWPSYSSDSPMGQVQARHVNKDEPVFFPFKGTDDTVEETSKRDPRLLSTRIYNSLMKFSSGMNAPESQFNLENSRGRGSAILEERAADLASIWKESKEVLESFDIDADSLFLGSHWARKTNRTYLQISEEMKVVLLTMFQKGQGVKNKAVRYTAERAVMELQDTLLQEKWDQRLVVSVGKVKGFFSRKHAAEEKDNDAHRAVLGEALELKLERGERLLEDSRAAEQAIVQSAGNLDQASLSHFAKLGHQQLKAFIRSRLLVDACSREHDKLPRKGSLRDAQNQVVCAKSGGPLLIQWAFDLRFHPITAKLISATDLAADLDMDQALYDAGCANDEAEEAVCFETLAGDVLNEMESGIVDADDEGFSSQEESEDSNNDEDDVDDTGSSDDDSL